MSDRSEIQTIRAQTELLSVAEGFFQSAILIALIRLRIFERLGTGAARLQELASELKADPDRLARLLSAGVAIKVLESADRQEYRVPARYHGILTDPDREGYLGNWLRNLDYFRTALTDLDQAATGDGPTFDMLAALNDNPDIGREFTLAMHDYAALRGKELAHFLDTASVKTVLDLGCGPGTYGFHLALANPSFELFLLDLPEVLETARVVQGRYGVTNKVTYLPQDALRDEIPGTYDLVMVSNTLHMLGEEKSRQLIRRLYDTVAPGGSLVIQAQFLRRDKMGGRWPICLDLVQLCITPTGRNHSAEETADWMRDAGFEAVDYCGMSIYNTNGFIKGRRG